MIMRMIPTVEISRPEIVGVDGERQDRTDGDQKE